MTLRNKSYRKSSGSKSHATKNLRDFKLCRRIKKFEYFRVSRISESVYNLRDFKIPNHLAEDILEVK